jgi:hypothetical protein
MAKAKTNPFDDLLASIGDETDRQALGEMAERYPNLKESVMLRSDYSRVMDENRDKVKLADAWDAWRQSNWVDNGLGEGKGATKRELEAQQKIQELMLQLQEQQLQYRILIKLLDMLILKV